MKTILLDQEVLQNLYGDCEESKNAIFSEFLSTYSEMKQNLFSSYESGDLSAMKKLLHFHGPSFMYLGVPQVAGYFKSLEMHCGSAKDCCLISAEFFRLLQMIDDTKMQVIIQRDYYKKAV